jgi:hypothetical protein
MTTLEGRPQAVLDPSAAHAAPLAGESAGFVFFISGSASNVAEAAMNATDRIGRFTAH